MSDQRPRARGSDPETSKKAAERAIKDGKMARIVEIAMVDGVPRIDQEIQQALSTLGYEYTCDRVRHGRLRLQDEGLVVLTGLRRKISNGGSSREWVFKPKLRRG